MAEEIGVDPGHTVAFSKNLHIYERDFKNAENLIKATPRSKVKMGE